MDKFLNFLETDWISLFSLLFILSALFITKLFWDGVHMKLFGFFRRKPTLTHINKYMDDLQPTTPSPASKELFNNFNPESYKEFQKEIFSSIQSQKPITEEK